jgi:glycosyltransferase involved in cell wall biosynthesis
VPWAINLYKRNKFQILNIHSPEYLGIGAVIFKKLFPKVMLVFHFHLSHTGFWFKNIDKFVLPRGDAVICDSEFLRKEVIGKYNLSKEKVFTNHCGTDLTIKKVPKDINLVKKYHLEGKKLIIFMGRFIARKNPIFLIKILEKLRARGHNAALIVVGDGPEKENMMREIERCHLKAEVIFPGFLRGGEKIKHYGLSDVFVFPSNNEGFVLVVLEALAAGLPLVVPRDRAFPEAVHDGKNGFLAEPNNLSDWVNKIEILFKNDVLRDEFGQYSRKLAEKEFSWRQMSMRNIKIYEKILGSVS